MMGMNKEKMNTQYVIRNSGAEDRIAVGVEALSQEVESVRPQMYIRPLAREYLMANLNRGSS